jgi:hypothetical protein
MDCKICNNSTEVLFNTKTSILNKYYIDYHRCTQCNFIQTDEPFWLNEAYDSAITSLDIGLVGRNIRISTLLSSLIVSCFNTKSSFLDYGGGYGMLVRTMRDLGYDFYRFDTHCENLFSVHFDIADTNTKKFELVTAFEVFEHLLDPVAETKKMLELSDSIFFSTELVPHYKISTSDDWWYFTPETGQHIALYSERSLQNLASQLNCNFYTNGKTLHLITRRDINPLLFNLSIRGKIANIVSKIFTNKSLLADDFKFIRGIANHTQGRTL